MYAQTLQIPKERVAILIGKEGIVKRDLEKSTKTKLEIKSIGEVNIKGDSEGVFFVSQVIEAIAKGFNPQIAKKLLISEYSLETIDLTHLFNTKNQLIRVKGRIIGEKGKIRKMIEEMTDCYISVYKNKITIIAPYYTMHYAKESISKLIKGARHQSVERYLSKIREQLIVVKLRGKEHADL